MVGECLIALNNLGEDTISGGSYSALEDDKNLEDARRWPYDQCCRDRGQRRHPGDGQLQPEAIETRHRYGGVMVVNPLAS